MWIYNQNNSSVSGRSGCFVGLWRFWLSESAPRSGILLRVCMAEYVKTCQDLEVALHPGGTRAGTSPPVLRTMNKKNKIKKKQKKTKLEFKVCATYVRFSKLDNATFDQSEVPPQRVSSCVFFQALSKSPWGFLVSLLKHNLKKWLSQTYSLAKSVIACVLATSGVYNLSTRLYKWTENRDIGGEGNVFFFFFG